jgi:glycolate oxidase
MAISTNTAHFHLRRGGATARKSKGPDIVDRLAVIVGEDRVTTDDLERQLYSQEIANLPPELVYVFNVKPDIVVRPSCTEDVAGVVKLAREHKIPVTPRGAGTLGLGGSVPSKGGILMDLSSMRRIVEVDVDTLSATVEAGVTWEELRNAARAKGLRVGAYPSSALSATVGGWLGGGGVGVGSYKYGAAADQVRWLEVVLPDGRVVETGFRGVMDNASGYALTNLFVGAEGTLGIITRATIKLHPRPGDVVPTAYAFQGLKEAARGILALTRSPVVPYNVSFVDGMHLENLKELGAKVPDAAGAVVTVALEGHPQEVALTDRETETAMGSAGGRRLSDEEAAESWDNRSYEFRVKRLGPGLVPGSVFVPAARFAESVDRVYDAIADLGMRAGITGLVADRNTVDLLPYYIVDDRRMLKNLAVMSFMKRLADMALALGGRPVGVGLWFAQNLGRVHGEGAVVMRQVKKALDPNDIMNPGKLVKTGTRYDLAVPGTMMGLGLDLLGTIKKVLPADTEEGELGGPGGMGWREGRADGDEVEWVHGRDDGKGTGKGTGKGKGKETGKETGKGKGKETGKVTGKGKGKETGKRAGKRKGKGTRKGTGKGGGR